MANFTSSCAFLNSSGFVLMEDSKKFLANLPPSNAGRGLAAITPATITAPGAAFKDWELQYKLGTVQVL